MWQSRSTFVFALAAAAVGLGNLWRFSYLVGTNGGAPFLLTYLGCLYLIVVPVLVAEVAMGSHGRGSVLEAFATACRDARLPRFLRWLGVLLPLSAVAVLVYYCVIAGWGLAYIEKLNDGLFAGASVLNVAESFGEFLDNPADQAHFHGLFLLAVLIISLLGLHRGVGLFFWLVVPATITLLGVLVEYSLRQGDLVAARDFLFSVQWADFGWHVVPTALTQAFYTIGVGLGVGVAFGAYAPDRVPIGRSVLAVATFDVLVGLTAGLVIYPLLFANNLQPTSGPGLLFIGLPYVFGNLPEGELAGTLFFSLLVIVAAGSVVALLEPVLGVLARHTRLPRPFAVVAAGLALWLLGFGVILSFSVWSQEPWFGVDNFLALLEWVSADVLIPLVSLLTVILVGWLLPRDILRSELYRESALFFSVWLLAVRTLAPAGIIWILIAGMTA